jgi:hypothetical protein
MKHGMSKRLPKLPLKPAWTFPHCGHLDTAATLLRLDSETLQCQACERPFSSIPDPKGTTA